ncbi:hypothetical protein [Hoeflea sp. TYP-13]|uniref:hypothetical protein n=1 Tax=Hoeflea sp. TYP-13 TaxID=3230023 RepID=UPI0034C6C541
MIWISKAIFWIVAAFYAYGALVHVMNMAGMSGFNWAQAPLKWQVLDVVYLILDVIVALGLVLAWRIGLVAFFAAAISQIVLYTVLRSWIVDVPEAFARTPEEIGYLDGLVVFHVATIILIIAAIWIGNAASASPTT